MTIFVQLALIPTAIFRGLEKKRFSEVRAGGGRQNAKGGLKFPRLKLLLPLKIEKRPKSFFGNVICLSVFVPFFVVFYWNNQNFRNCIPPKPLSTVLLSHLKSIYHDISNIAENVTMIQNPLRSFVARGQFRTSSLLNG